MPQNPEQPVARARKRIDYTEHRARWGSGGNARNVLADAISEGIAHRLERGTGKDADAARVPLARRHPVERNRARVAEAVAAKFFDLPQLDDLVALGRTQQKVTIIVRSVSVGHLPPL